MISKNELDREGYIRSKSLEYMKKNKYLIKNDKVKIPESIDYYLITDEVNEIILDNGLYAKKILVGDINLKTNKKTYLEAINELSENNLGNINLNNYQTKIDENLNTTNKEIVGSINEINNNLKNIEIDANKITSGIIDISRIPAAALERLIEVENDSIRFSLTKEQIQLGDTVKVKETSLMYRVINEDKLNSEEGYTVYVAGRAAEVPWNGIIGKPNKFTPEEHTHDYISTNGGIVKNDLTINTKIITPQIILNGYLITVEE